MPIESGSRAAGSPAVQEYLRSLLIGIAAQWLPSLARAPFQRDNESDPLDPGASFRLGF
jgi:hypothetical protein